MSNTLCGNGVSGAAEFSCTTINAVSPYILAASGECQRELYCLGMVAGHYGVSRDRESGDCWRSEDYRLVGGYVLFADDEAASDPDAPIAPDGYYWHLATSDCYWLVAERQPLAEVITVYQLHWHATKEERE